MSLHHRSRNIFDKLSNRTTIPWFKILTSNATEFAWFVREGKLNCQLSAKAKVFLNSDSHQATQLNRTVLLRRVVDVFTPSNATHQNCLVEMRWDASRRSRVHTKRRDSTKRFRCVASVGVNTITTRDDQFSPVFQILNIFSFWPVELRRIVSTFTPKDATRL